MAVEKNIEWSACWYQQKQQLTGEKNEEPAREVAWNSSSYMKSSHIQTCSSTRKMAGTLRDLKSTQPSKKHVTGTFP